jgi:hypothetical protein
MNDNESASNSTNVSSLPRRSQYQNVYNGRKRKIRGLWVRNGRYYAQMTVKNAATGKKSVPRIPLEAEENGVKRPVATVPEAVAAQKKLQVQRAENKLPTLGQKPKFCDFAKTYLASPITLNKGPETIKTETVHINAWIKYLGETRLADITKPIVTAFREQRLKDVEPATVNGAVTVLRNVLNKAIDDGILQRMPFENIKPLTVIREDGRRKSRRVPVLLVCLVFAYLYLITPYYDVWDVNRMIYFQQKNTQTNLITYQ